MANFFETLLAQRGEHAFTGLPVGPLPSYLAVDSQGRPALAVPVPLMGTPQSLETEYLSLTLFTRAAFTSTDGTQTEGVFHLLTCKKGGIDVVGPFELLATGLANGLALPTQATDRLWSTFETLCELFRMKPAADLNRVRTGLWGELFFMRELGGFSTLLPFWHTEPERKFDFSCGPYRIEVKATTGSERVHRFSHGQLYSAGDTEIVVGSLLLRYEDAGLSLADLIEHARNEAGRSPELRIKLEKAVRVAGMADVQEDGPRFDAGEARSQARIYRAFDIPHFPMQEPPGISGTTYSVSIGASPAWSMSVFKTWLSKW